jgi:LacI family transcriptional regulator
MPSNTYTMSDVARRAGVHPATVSRALRGDPRITPAQQIKIRRVAEELGYRTNPLVAALMRARRAGHGDTYRATFAYITKYPSERAAAFARDFGQLLVGARARALAQGYRLEEFNLDNRTISGRRVTGILESRGIDGLLVAPLHTVHDAVELDWERFSSVAIGYSLRHVPVNRVAHNHFAAFTLAAHECRRAGWQRLGLVLQRRVHEKVEKRWVAACLLDQSEHRAADRVPPLLVDELNEKQFVTWFKRHRPEVLLAVSVPTLLGYLKNIGQTVPGDVCIVSLDRRPPDRGIAGINQDYTNLGANAVDILISMTHRNERGVQRKPLIVLSDGEWTGGPTLRTR